MRVEAAVGFTPRELFQIPFGSNREALGARVEGPNFLVPRDFSMDNGGHFFIFDTNNHRIARYSYDGKFEMDFRYVPTARQVFAHPDSHQNLWILVTEPGKGMYYGVYDPHGKLERSGIFAQFNRFRLHLDDHGGLHVIVSSDQSAAIEQTYLLEESSLLMKKENIARPPETHHEVRQNDRVFFIDQVPGGTANDDAHRVNRITDASHRGIGEIKGAVLYVTDRGEVYTRISEREIDVYDVRGLRIGQIQLSGLGANAVRFDADGNLYQLDGIPDKAGQYSPQMPGMRMVLWQRS